MVGDFYLAGIRLTLWVRRVSNFASDGAIAQDVVDVRSDTLRDGVAESTGPGAYAVGAA